MRRLIVIILAVTALGCLCANDKLSPWLRRMVQSEHPLPLILEEGRSVRGSSMEVMASQRHDRGKQSEVCAFVRISDDGEGILANNGSRALARFGNVYIASIPVARLRQLAAEPSVSRIEAREACHLLMDSTAKHINAMPAYAGVSLPHPFTGRGVVVGVQDVGFDLTHPNFYSPDLSEYRIKALWDQLSTDTIGSPFPVGAEYVGKEALLSYAHSRDGDELSHGTNTLGMAAGSGFNSTYRGIAWESDICLVANAVSDDAELIDSADVYKYTSATDALGFKYLFDYAASVGKPCVVSFSEGSHQDLAGDDLLYYEVLDSLTGPGRIMVASAGNEGISRNYFHKPRGTESAGAYLRQFGHLAFVQMKADNPIDIRFIVKGETADTIVIPSRYAIESPDSEYIDTLQLSNGKYVFDIMAYPSCYNPATTAIEAGLVSEEHNIGYDGFSISLEAVGREADVECFTVVGQFENSKADDEPHLKAAFPSHNILSPSSAPTVICVGSTSYRGGITNLSGKWQSNGLSTTGDRASFSSIGPTLDGRTKPDVLAPGNYIVSSYSSYYLEKHPDARDNVSSTIATFDWNGRTYPWTTNCGTSMSCPVVAGAIALWLQAKPDLTPEEALEAISATSRHPRTDIEYPNNQYGYGEIDVYRGLLHILGIDRIEAVSTSPLTALHRLPSPTGTLTLQLPENASAPIRLTLYSLKGQRLSSTVAMPAGSSTVSMPIPPFAGALCVLQADSSDPGLCGSMIISNK